MDEAERRVEESIEFRRRHNAGRLSVAVETANLGDLAAECGQIAKAAGLLGDALAFSCQIGSA